MRNFVRSLHKRIFEKILRGGFRTPPINSYGPLNFGKCGSVSPIRSVTFSDELQKKHVVRIDNVV